MSITLEKVQELVGNGKVVTERGEKVGSIGEIDVDDVTGARDWVTARTGLVGLAETFVPLEAAHVESNGLVVPYAKDLIKGAPRIETDGALSPQEEQVLYRHSGVGHSGTGLHDPGLADPSDRTSQPDQTTDVAMTRLEERFVVGTQEHEAGRTSAQVRRHRARDPDCAAPPRLGPCHPRAAHRR